MVIDIAGLGFTSSGFGFRVSGVDIGYVLGVTNNSKPYLKLRALNSKNHPFVVLVALNPKP